jgi:hypothetical protein
MSGLDKLGRYCHIAGIQFSNQISQLLDMEPELSLLYAI